MLGLAWIVKPTMTQVCVQVPIGGESDFAGVFDLVRMKAITWNGEVSFSPAPGPVKANSRVL